MVTEGLASSLMNIVGEFQVPFGALDGESSSIPHQARQRHLVNPAWSTPRVQCQRYVLWRVCCVQSSPF